MDPAANASSAPEALPLAAPPEGDPGPELPTRASVAPRAFSGAVALAYLAFFLSGAAALVYEISWARQIGLILGHTADAAAAVLTAYFVGLAIGYALGARLSGIRRPLLGYALAEALAAGWAIVVPIAIRAVEAHDLLARIETASGIASTVVRWLFCFGLLLPATAALGATLPLMSDWLAPRGDRSRERVVAAYAINTVGAFVGSIVAPILLLAHVGVVASSHVAAVISLACAALAVALERVAPAGPPPLASNASNQSRDVVAHADATDEADSRDDVEPPAPSFFRTALLPAAASGFGVLALEVLYSRLFSLVFHNSTYTFGAVLAAAIVSLAAGSALAGQLVRHRPAETWLAWAAAGGATLLPLSIVVFTLVTRLEYFEYGRGFAEYLAGAFGLVALVVAPPIVLLGAILPLCFCGRATRDDAAGRTVGRIAFVNVIAGALGAAAASFALMPAAGLWGSFTLASLGFFALAIVVARPSDRLATALAAATLASVVLAPFVFTDGPERWVGATRDRIVKRWDSAYGWIDVIESPDGVRRVRQNLHYRYGSTGSDAPRAYRQARLPLLLHPAPRDALFLGLGTGLTAGGAVADRELERGVVVELIPEVVEAARLLKDSNFDVVDEPRFETVVDDGRHYLASSDRRFDVIAADLFVPWESETGYLYTVENYEHALDRLKPGGLFCQWLAVYQMGPNEFELIADSFKTVFPHASLWWGHVSARRPIVALVGSREPLAIDAARIDARLKEMFAHAPLDEEIADAGRLLNLYMGEWTIRRPEYLNTDERPRVEFLTPVSQLDRGLLQNATLRDYYDRVLSTLPDASASFANAPRGTTSPRAWHRVRMWPREN